MMTFTNILTTIALIIIVYIGLKLIRSYRFKSYYAQYAKSMGFKVYEHPYCWFNSMMFKQYKKQQKQTGDANFHYKHHLQKYDLIVSNIILNTMLEIENPQLAKEFYLKANEGYYAKYDFGIAALKRLIGKDSLLMAEGDEWKSRRKILSSVFNYDFIISQIPKIHQITKDTLNKYE